jgi:esterase
VADVITFIEALGASNNVNLLGHSRGGHIAFRVAQQRPDLLHKLILAEPSGDLDASLASSDATTASRPPLRSHVATAAEKIVAGDIEGGLTYFVDGSTAREGGGYRKQQKQEWRDNACTLLGQINEQRQPYSRSDAESIRVPTLFVGGENTPGSLPIVLHALAAHVAGARGASDPTRRTRISNKAGVRQGAIRSDRFYPDKSTPFRAGRRLLRPKAAQIFHQPDQCSTAGAGVRQRRIKKCSEMLIEDV